MAKMLIKPVTTDLDYAALENLSDMSAPGIDGFTGEIYKPFAAHFVPLMFEVYQQPLEDPQVPESWAPALFNPIPKGLGLVGVHKLRSLVLQNLTTNGLHQRLSRCSYKISSRRSRRFNSGHSSKAAASSTIFGTLSGRGPQKNKQFIAR